MSRIVLFLVSLAIASSSVSALGQVPACAWNPSTRHALARMVRLESTREADVPAIANVLVRRWRAFGRWRGWTFRETVVRYSRTLRRLDEARASGLDVDAAAVLVGRSRWRAAQIRAGYSGRTRELLEAWQRGELADTCAEPAWHWLAPGHASRLRRIECSGTANVFFDVAPEIRDRAFELLRQSSRSGRCE